jgi:hypothetical protein
MHSLDARDREQAGSSSGFSSHEAFEEILSLHRRGAPLEEVHFVDRLCFALEERSAEKGTPFVLWQPVAIFLQHGFCFDVDEELCEGHVVLASLPDDAAEFAAKIIPHVEAVRRKIPLSMVGSGPQILLHLLPDVSESLRWHDQSSSERVERMYLEFRKAVRRGDYSGLSALRAQLSELAGVAPETDVRVCVDFLRRAADQKHSWPDHAAALASEQVLSRDWLTPEEDAAWSHL